MNNEENLVKNQVFQWNVVVSLFEVTHAEFNLMLCIEGSTTKQNILDINLLGPVVATFLQTIQHKNNSSLKYLIFH